MRKFLIVTLLFTTLLTACGKSGPLYLPNSEKTMQQLEQEEQDQQIHPKNETKTPS